MLRLTRENGKEVAVCPEFIVGIEDHLDSQQQTLSVLNMLNNSTYFVKEPMSVILLMMDQYYDAKTSREEDFDLNAFGNKDDDEEFESEDSDSFEEESYS